MKIRSKSFILFFIIFIGCNSKVTKQTTTSIQTTTAPTRIAFGSCNKHYLDQAYWNNIALENPDLFVWTGDIIYADTNNPDTLKKQYDVLKRNPMYYRFKKLHPVIGIWDDHDYGMSDGDQTHIIKKESRDLLFDFLEIPLDNIAYQREGAYQSYVYGEGKKSVKIILLDARYFRDPLQSDKSGHERYIHNTKGTILGNEQWEWLENELYNSKASINIIVSGIQVLSAQHKYEKWENFPNERKRLLDLIRDSRVKNPYIWSGDRHIGEISKYTTIDSKFEIFDITSSGLTHSYQKAEEQNDLRVSPLIKQRNFGILDIEWRADSIHIKHLIKGFYKNIHTSLEQTVEY